MAAADCAGGGTWRPVQLCRGNPALLRNGRAFSGKFLRGARQIPRQLEPKIECWRWQCRIRFGSICAAAPTRLGRPVRTVSFSGRTERPGSASEAACELQGGGEDSHFQLLTVFWNGAQTRAL